jgi:hypothetical protein
MVIIQIILLLGSASFQIPVQAQLQNDPQGIPRGQIDPEYTVETWVPSKTWNGTTIFGNMLSGEIVEVNMWGEVVWRYKITGHTTKTSIAGVMIISGSNNVLFSVLEPENMRGAYEVNRQGQLVWSFKDRRVSHDAVRLPNGNTLITAGHSEDYSPWPYTDPQIFEVDPRGQIVWVWYAKNAYANHSKYKDVRSTDFGPWTHVNGALRLPDGTTMISPRNFDLTIIVDSAGKVVKEIGDQSSPLCDRRGIPECPHSPIPLANGNILIGEPTVGRSIELDPRNNRIVFQWPLGGSRPPDHIFVRASQRLPNDNTLVVDSNGALVEVTKGGDIVWKLKARTYAPNGPGTAFFFQAERLGYMPPTLTVREPSPGRYYASSKIPIVITEGFDVAKITYSVHDNSKNTWIVQNSTAIENVFKDFLSSPTKNKGPDFIDLPNGEYTLKVVASSTGFGYKDFVNPKRVNYAVREIKFTVNRPLAQVFKAEHQQDKFDVNILSNSTVGQFEFSQPSKLIRFKVSGKDGTKGFVEVVIPIGLLSGQFTVQVDGRNVDFSRSTNTTHTIIRIDYGHSEKTITIIGTNVVPEFPLSPTITLALMMLASVLLIHKLSRTKIRN